MASSYSYPPQFDLRTVEQVTDQSTLTGTLRSDRVYHIDGPIVMQQSIVVPDTGLYITGSNANLPGLDCAGAFPLFVGGGRLDVKNCQLSASATGASVFDLTATTGNESAEFVSVNFQDCKSLGTISGYRQGLWQNVGLFSCDDGLTLAGSWAGGFRASTVIVRGFDIADAGGTVLKGATGATFASRVVSDANIVVNGTSTAYHFTEAMFLNDADFQLLGGEIAGTGTYLSGIDATSTRALFDTVGLPRTAPGGKWVLTAEVATTGTGSVVKLAGTTTASDLVWMDMPASNRMRWLSSLPANLRVMAVLTATSSNNNQIELYLKVFDKSDVEQGSFAFPAFTTNGAGRAEGATLAQFVSVEEGWYIEVHTRNLTGANDITGIINSVLLIEARKNV